MSRERSEIELIRSEQFWKERVKSFLVSFEASILASEKETTNCFDKFCAFLRSCSKFYLVKPALQKSKYTSSCSSS